MFITKFTKAGVVDERNKQVVNEIALVEQGCDDFKLECVAIDGKMGIWLNLGNCQLLVKPLELISSIYNDEWYFMDILSDNQSYCSEVTIRKTSHSYEWSVLCASLSLHMVLRFKYDEYIEKIKCAIKSLHEAYSHNCKIAYKEAPEGAKMRDAVGMCIEQLQIEALYPSHYKLMTDKVCQEEFVFHVVGDHEEHFRIGIGTRSYETWFSAWENSLEAIRHQLESLLLIYNRECEIDLDFDMSTTLVRAKFVSVLDKIEEVGEGYGFKYKEYVLVKILPNEFVNMPIIAGYCDRKQFVKTMYEGLLSLALQYPLQNEDDEDRIEAYAKIKSPLIEQYIVSEDYDRCKARQRDARVKDAIVIKPDYDQLWGDSLLRDCAPHSIDRNGQLDCEDIYDQDGNPIVMPELSEWQHEIEPIVIASECGELYEKDWVDYHRRGLEIAHDLRKMLSRDFDLWYEAPFEDKSETIPRKLLIL